MIIKAIAAKINTDNGYKVQERDSKQEITRDRPATDSGLFLNQKIFLLLGCL